MRLKQVCKNTTCLNMSILCFDKFKALVEILWV